MIDGGAWKRTGSERGARRRVGWGNSRGCVRLIARVATTYVYADYSRHREEREHDLRGVSEVVVCSEQATMGVRE